MSFGLYLWQTILILALFCLDDGVRFRVPGVSRAETQRTSAFCGGVRPSAALPGSMRSEGATWRAPHGGRFTGFFRLSEPHLPDLVDPLRAAVQAIDQRSRPWPLCASCTVSPPRSPGKDPHSRGGRHFRMSVWPRRLRGWRQWGASGMPVRVQCTPACRRCVVRLCWREALHKPAYQKSRRGRLLWTYRRERVIRLGGERDQSQH